jgi:hypothetical protein
MIVEQYFLPLVEAFDANSNRTDAKGMRKCIKDRYVYIGSAIGT